MKKYQFAAIFCAALLFSLAGCVHVAYAPASPAQQFAPTDSVRLFRNYPEAVHTVIGSYRASGNSEKKILEKLVEEAKKIGAHALVVKPPEIRENQYTSEMRTEFKSREVIVEAIAIRFEQLQGK